MQIEFFPSASSPNRHAAVLLVGGCCRRWLSRGGGGGCKTFPRLYNIGRREWGKLSLPFSRGIIIFVIIVVFLLLSAAPLLSSWFLRCFLFSFSPSSSLPGCGTISQLLIWKDANRLQIIFRFPCQGKGVCKSLPSSISTCIRLLCHYYMSCPMHPRYSGPCIIIFKVQMRWTFCILKEVDRWYFLPPPASRSIERGNPLPLPLLQ